MLNIGKHNVIYFEANKKTNIIGIVEIRGDLVTIYPEEGVPISIFKEKIIKMERL